MRKAVIDRFVIPNASREEFFMRGRITRELIRGLPGLVSMSAYSREEGEALHFLTVALWESEEAVTKAGEAIVASFHREGFDNVAFFNRLGVTLERAIYDEAK